MKIKDTATDLVWFHASRSKQENDPVLAKKNSQTLATKILVIIIEYQTYPSTNASCVVTTDTCSAVTLAPALTNAAEIAVSRVAESSILIDPPMLQEGWCSLIEILSVIESMSFCIDVIDLGLFHFIRKGNL